jgi:hypothetical protein
MPIRDEIGTHAMADADDNSRWLLHLSPIA